MLIKQATSSKKFAYKVPLDERLRLTLRFVITFSSKKTPSVTLRFRECEPSTQRSIFNACTEMQIPNFETYSVTAHGSSLAEVGYNGALNRAGFVGGRNS